MLLVCTMVGPSAIEGLGLFAVQRIPAGTLVARWDERFAVRMSRDEFGMLPLVAREFVNRYGWVAKDDHWRTSIDNSRFLNHSAAPNLIVTVTADCAYQSHARRDIAAGEELTEDYREFDPEFEDYGSEWSTQAALPTKEPVK